LDYWAFILYDLVMKKTSEFRAKPSEPSSSVAAKAVLRPASHTGVPLNRGGFSVIAALEPAQKSLETHCLWCGRAVHTAFHGWIDPEVLLLGT